MTSKAIAELCAQRLIAWEKLWSEKEIKIMTSINREKTEEFNELAIDPAQ
jgi:hypothetical protein